MGFPVGQYTFRTAKNQLQFQPRTLNDLENSKHFESAAETARSMKSDVHETYLDMLALDQSEYDLNKSPGSVLLNGHEMSVGRVSGHAVALKSTGKGGGEVMKADIESGESRVKFRYTLEPKRDFMSAHRVIDEGTSTQVSESLVRGSYIQEGVTQYQIAAGPDAPAHLKALTNAPYAPDRVVSFPREKVSHTVGSLEGEQIDFQPQRLDDLKGLEERRELIALGNEARNLVTSIYSGVLALDGTKKDLNPRKGEVLFKDVELEGRTMSGYLSCSEVVTGDTTESLKHGHGDYPYLLASSPSTNEKFTVLLQDPDSPLPRQLGKANAELSYENGVQEVRVEQTPHGLYDDEPQQAYVELRKQPAPKEVSKSWWERIFG